MSLRLTEIPFASLLSYSTKGHSPSINHARGVMVLLKQDTPFGTPPILMSEWVAREVDRKRNTPPFSRLFRSNPVLVPTPSSSLMKEGTLWVPERLAAALFRLGLGSQVLPCLFRTEAVPRSHLSPSWARPLAQRHYETMAVQGAFGAAHDIVLVDDLVTRGATLIGAANRLLDAFPDARIAAFAAMRAVGNPDEFSREYDPRSGTVRLRSDGQSFRRP